jgi:hypothetical protein
VYALKRFAETLHRSTSARSDRPVGIVRRVSKPLKRTEQAMKQTLIIKALALGLGFLSTPSLASNYIVNGHAASPAEAQHLVASGVQQGAWVVNGYGIAPAEHASFTTTEPSSGKKCYYVLDVLLCD